VVGVVAVAALFVSMAWTTFEANGVGRGGHLGRLNGASELALATIAMVAIYGLARILVFEPSAERSKELRR
jgi:hypothetical protein